MKNGNTGVGLLLAAILIVILGGLLYWYMEEENDGFIENIGESDSVQVEL